ncbi:MAG: von Willebrand factor type A domain-containing protein [Planctomycetota bacterium]
MTNGIEGLHEKLCAYVLGEADEATRVEVERELAASAELRAEKARIESTIGLVKSALGGDEVLSAERTEQVLTAAKQPPSRSPIQSKGRPWYTLPAMKLAAGLSAVAIGYIAFQAANRQEGAAITGYGTDAHENAFVQHADGKLTPYGESAQKRAESQLGEKLAAARSKGTFNGPGDTVPPVNAPTVADAQSMEALRSLGYAGDESGRTRSKDQKSDAVVAALDALDGRADASSSYPFEGDASQQMGIDAEALKKERRESLEGGTAIGVGHGGTSIGVGSGGHSGAPNAAFSKRPGDAMLAGESASSAPVVVDAQTAAELNEASRRALRASKPGSPGPGPSSPSGESVAAAAAPVTERFRALGYVEDDDAQPAHGAGASGSNEFFLGQGWRGIPRAEERLHFPSPEERERYIDDECRRIVTWCRPRPNERPRDMFFRFWGDNGFEFASLDAQSTFSVDVDTASYVLARRYIDEGNVPTKAQVRTEEFVNYFKPDVAAPTEGTFRIHTDLAPSRFSNDQARWMLRVVVRGRDVSKEERKPLALTFVIDTSGSMKEQNRLETVKHSLRLLASQLDAHDRIAVVRYSDEASIVLPMTSAAQRATIETAIEVMQPQGSTNSEAGLKLGYAIALDNLDSNATNRVVFLSDGVANRGETDPVKLSDTVKSIRERGVYLNTIGVGMNNHNDVFLEQLANKGDGVCNYVDTSAEAKKVLVDRFTGAFEPIARDVKVQVEFDPAQVHRYRLLGYENRAIADKDFRNDKVDAGEVGAGHSVTAMYDVVLKSTATSPLTVRLRHKGPDAKKDDAATENTYGMDAASLFGAFDQAPQTFRFAAAVTAFAEVLRQSPHAKEYSLADVLTVAKGGAGDARDQQEMVELVKKAAALSGAAKPEAANKVAN